MSQDVTNHVAYLPTPFDDSYNMKFQEAVAWLFGNNPFWAAMLTSNNLRIGFAPASISGQITTAATDGYTTIWLNRAFFDKEVFVKARTLGVSETAAMLYVNLHEVAHILADHCSEHHRANMPDRQLASIAVDYQVFDMLAKDNFLPPNCMDPCPIDQVFNKSRQPDPRKVAFYGDVNLHRHVPDGDSVLAIYKYLEQQQQQQAKGGGKPNASGAGQAPGMSDDLKPEFSPGGDSQGGSEGNEASDLDAQQPSQGQEQPPSQQERQEQARDEMIANAVITAKTIGNMSNTAQRMANALTKSRTPWAKQLANLMSAAVTRAVERKRSYRRIGRRTQAGIVGTSTSDYAIKPGRIKDPKPPVVVAVDTSGSIGQRELDLFASELTAILASGKIGAAHVVYCSAETEDGPVFNPRDKVVLKPTVSGGTDFEPVWHWQRKHVPEAAAIIYLTDLMGAFGDKKSWPKIPVIWGATMQLHPPFGKFVYVEQ